MSSIGAHQSNKTIMLKVSILYVLFSYPGTSMIPFAWLELWRLESRWLIIIKRLHWYAHWLDLYMKNNILISINRRNVLVITQQPSRGSNGGHHAVFHFLEMRQWFSMQGHCNCKGTRKRSVHSRMVSAHSGVLLKWDLKYGFVSMQTLIQVLVIFLASVTVSLHENTDSISSHYVKIPNIHC